MSGRLWAYQGQDEYGFNQEDEASLIESGILVKTQIENWYCSDCGYDHDVIDWGEGQLFKHCSSYGVNDPVSEDERFTLCWNVEAIGKRIAEVNRLRPVHGHSYPTKGVLLGSKGIRQVWLFEHIDNQFFMTDLEHIEHDSVLVVIGNFTPTSQQRAIRENRRIHLVLIDSAVNDGFNLFEPTLIKQSPDQEADFVLDQKRDTLTFKGKTLALNKREVLLVLAFVELTTSFSKAQYESWIPYPENSKMQPGNITASKHALNKLVNAELGLPELVFYTRATELYSWHPDYTLKAT